VRNSEEGLVLGYVLCFERLAEGAGRFYYLTCWAARIAIGAGGLGEKSQVETGVTEKSKDLTQKTRRAEHRDHREERQDENAPK
jgi:hypothetical protein